MKKQLFLLPLLGGLVLSGCTIKIGNKTIKLFEKKGSGESVEWPDNWCAEFQGYKIATEVKEGVRYLLGNYRVREDIMRFANGDYHRDDKGYYPFYMGTVAKTVEGAAEIEIKFTNKEEGEFSMQMFCRGQVWHQKYIGVYAAESSFGNQVMSIALLDSPDQTSYTDPKSNKTYTPSGVFKFYKEFDGMMAYAPAAPFQYPDRDEEKVPKFFGTGHASEGDDFTSMDCKSYETALLADDYDLSHLYEKK